MQVKIVTLPAGKDVTEWIEDHGGNRKKLIALLKTAPIWTPGTQPVDKDGGKADDNQDGTQAQVLIGMALASGLELFHDAGANKEGYATLPLGGHFETHRLRTKTFRRWLERLFYERRNRPASAQAVQDALGVLDARAIFDGKAEPVAVRLAGGESIHLDLGDEAWNVVKITREGWHVLATPEIKFIRPRGLQALPTPIKGGGLADLRSFVNVGSDDDWKLVVGWLVAALRPIGPYPVLCLHGEQGSAKSTAARVLRALLDPNSAALRSEPRDPRDLIIAATNSWIVALDNLSHLSPWLSDALCRLATGGGFATRELYTDDDEMLFNAQRPVILNGIEELATRGDLLERSIIVTLPAIAERDRSRGANWSMMRRDAGS